jgi:cytochrome P450
VTQTQAAMTEGGYVSIIDRDPADYYDALREQGGVVWDESTGTYLVTSAELMAEVARKDHVLWYSPIEVRGSIVPYELPEDIWWRYAGSRHRLTSVSGERQKHVHRWWLQAFSDRASINRWRAELIDPIAHAAIDDFASSGRADLMADYAKKVGQRVILGVLGLTYEDEWLDELQHQIHIAEELFAHVGGVPSEALVERSIAAADAIYEMMLPYIEQQREGAGFIGKIWRDGDELFGEGQWNPRDVVEVASLAFMGGSETVVATVANGIYLLLTQPELQTQLRADPTLMRVFVEETLRLHGTSSFVRRVATQDLELGGVAIKEGEAVLLLSECVGKDPRTRGCPRDVRLDRENPTDHFAFWRGPRQCVGRGLARTELAGAFTSLLGRLDDIRLDTSAAPPSYDGFLLRRWMPLNATFAERARS